MSSVAQVIKNHELKLNPYLICPGNRKANMKALAEMSVDELKHYVSTVELSVEAAPLREQEATVVRHSKLSGPVVDTTAPISASISGNTVVTFLGSLPRQAREDVENSVEFSRLAANAAVKDSGEEWVHHFLDTFARIGWTYASDFRSTSKLADRQLTMDKVALDLLAKLAGAFTGTGLAQTVVLEAVTSTFEALKKQKGPFALFKEKTASGNSSGFQAVVCEQDKDGLVQIKIGCVRCKADMNHTKVLFWDWSRSSVETVTAHAGLSLAIRFDAVRDIIRQRLLATSGQNFAATIKLEDR